MVMDLLPLMQLRTIKSLAKLLKMKQIQIFESIFLLQHDI